jgi:hypothetical protein
MVEEKAVSNVVFFPEGIPEQHTKPLKSVYPAASVPNGMTLQFRKVERMDGPCFYPLNPLAAQMTGFAALWYNSPLDYLTEEHLSLLRQMGFDVRFPEGHPIPCPPAGLMAYRRNCPIEPRHFRDDA